jgi:hypothetical protein
MNVQRTATVAAALWLGGVCLTACSGGIITPGATSSPSRPAAASHPPSSPPATPSLHISGTPSLNIGGTSSASVVNGRVKVSGPLGSFPVPPGAGIIENVTTGRTVDLILDSVTPSRVSSFYGSALPHAGYTITSNTSITGSIAGTSIKFTGHGYKGTIGAASGVAGISGTVVGITLTLQ